MAILNEYGQPATMARRFAHAADRSRIRGPQFSSRSCSIDELIPPNDRLTLVSLSQRLYTNKGVPRAAIDQKAEYSVGSAYMPEYGGSDSGAGDEAESWLNNVWYPNCDVRGGVYDWNQLLILASISIDREGETFVMLSETKEIGFPLIQIIPGHKVRSHYAEKEVEDGPYKGARIHDGIIYSTRNRPIAYRVYSSQEDFEDISARTIIHLFNPRYQEQGRGLPAFTHALEDLKHCLQSTEDERRRQAILSGLGLIVTNELGGPDLNDPAIGLSVDTTTNEGDAYENRNGIYYLTANAGESLEQIKHDSPGEVWSSFHDRMIREAVIGVGWAYSLVWKPTGQGTAERGEIVRARRAIEARQKLLDYLARRVTSYAVSYGIESGDVPSLRSPLRWRFTRPPRLSVDDGREAKAEAEGFRMGSINLSTILEGRGESEETFLKKRIDTLKQQKVAIYEANQELASIGTQIEPREIVMLTPNEVAETATTTDENDTTDN